MRKNQNGFGFIALLVLVVLVCALALTGRYVWQSPKHQTPLSQSNSSQTQYKLLSASGHDFELTINFDSHA